MAYGNRASRDAAQPKVLTYSRVRGRERQPESPTKIKSVMCTLIDVLAATMMRCFWGSVLLT
jgi:hypothetical protein